MKKRTVSVGDFTFLIDNITYIEVFNCNDNESQTVIHTSSGDGKIVATGNANHCMAFKENIVEEINQI